MDEPLTSIPALVSRRAASNGNEIILRNKDRGIWKAITWSALDARVREIGTALLEAGIGRGDVVAILSETRPEAVYADLAVLGCGAAAVAIDPDDEPDSVCHQLSSSGSRVAFVENEEQLDKVLSVRGRCPALSRIVVFDMKGLRDFVDATCVGLNSFAGAGDSVGWAGATKAIEAAQPAIIQFSDGGGLGRTLTHGDLGHMVRTARTRLPIKASDERLAVSRLANLTERIWGLYLALETRCISNYPERADTAIENLRELQPTVLGAEAAVWDRLQTLAAARAKDATATQRLAYNWALRAGRGGGPQRQLANLLVLQAVRREFGLNKLRLAYVGGVSVGPMTMDWARSLGIVIQQVDEAEPGQNRAEERFGVLMHNAQA